MTTVDSFSKHLFWDVDRSSMDLEKDASLIVHRALEFGLMKDWLLIRDYFGLERIASIAKELPDLDPVSLNFVAHLSGTDKTEYKCYILRQLQPKHWIY